MCIRDSLQTLGLQVGGDQLGEVTGLGHVGLVEHDDPGAFGQRPATEVGVGHIERQLAFDDLQVGERVTAGLEGGAVDDVHEHRAALDVTEELQTPVSYTHLDVYKRQESAWATSSVEVSRVVMPAALAIAAASTLVDMPPVPTWAVSYTQLDGYN